MRQISKSQRRLAAGAFLIIAAPIVATSVAYACQALATLHANPRTTTAGSTVAVFGTNYSGNASSTPIEIRLDGRNGQLLASFSPRGTLNDVPVPIPADLAAGTHTLLALQYTSSGNAVSGTPGRASLEITVAARTSGESSGAGATASTGAAAADPVAATPAAMTPAAPAASAPAASGAATAPQVVASAPAAAAATSNVAAPATADGTTLGSPAAPTAAAAAAPAAAAEQTASAAGPASVNVGLLPASASESSGSLPGLAMAAGLALVLLALGAFIKTGRNLTGRTTPLAG